jgi:hypothetical protein
MNFYADCSQCAIISTLLETLPDWAPLEFHNVLSVQSKYHISRWRGDFKTVLLLLLLYSYNRCSQRQASTMLNYDNHTMQGKALGACNRRTDMLQ